VISCGREGQAWALKLMRHSPRSIRLWVKGHDPILIHSRRDRLIER
jgi:hypothetical protein